MANYCNNCGKQINPDDSFCNNCGTDLQSANNFKAQPGYPTRQYTTQPKLYRSVDDRWVAGVCGGLGRHFNIDPILIRIAFILAIMSGFGLVVYIVLAIFVEEDPSSLEYSPPRSGKPKY